MQLGSNVQEGKVVSKSKVKEAWGMPAGAELEMGNWELQVDATMDEQHFRLAACDNPQLHKRPSSMVLRYANTLKPVMQHCTPWLSAQAPSSRDTITLIQECTTSTTTWSLYCQPIRPAMNPQGRHDQYCA